MSIIIIYVQKYLAHIFGSSHSLTTCVLATEVIISRIIISKEAWTCTNTMVVDDDDDDDYDVANELMMMMMYH